MNDQTLLKVHELTVDFRVNTYKVKRAVDAVSFEVAQGETVGLIGESGSGKSTIGNAILGLVRPSGGKILLEGADITDVTARRRLRISDDIQVIFQDPYCSLNPARTIGQTLADPLRARRRSRSEITSRAAWALANVGLPADTTTRYPSEFSGGQRQRIAIARALMLQPKLIICDEPTSSLDVSVQAQVINLLMELRTQMDLSYIFVSHDLTLVRHISDRIIVLRDGQVVEKGPADMVTRTPQSAYTKLLLASALVPDPAAQARRKKSRHLSEMPVRLDTP